MNELTTLQQQDTMSSMQIAEVTGKQHQHVMRDIKALLDQGVDASNFGLISYTDSMNRQQPCYQLTKKGCLILASGYNALLREKIIDRWSELEAKHQYQVPQSFSQALLLAAQQQEKIELQNKEILALTSTITSMEKKVTYMDKIFACPSTVKTTTIAQDYGMSAVAFNKLLHGYGIQYRIGDVWNLYAKYLPCGYVKDVPFEYRHANGMPSVKSNMQWTQKGRAFLYEELKSHGILPLIEAE